MISAWMHRTTSHGVRVYFYRVAAGTVLRAPGMLFGLGRRRRHVEEIGAQHDASGKYHRVPRQIGRHRGSHVSARSPQPGEQFVLIGRSIPPLLRELYLERAPPYRQVQTCQPPRDILLEAPPGPPTQANGTSAPLTGGALP